MFLFVENVVDRRHRRDLAVFYDCKYTEIVFRAHVYVADPLTVPRGGSGDLINVETVRERESKIESLLSLTASDSAVSRSG